MDLLTFVKQLNPAWVLAPIYLKGARMLSGKEATGKNPLEVAFDRNLNKDDALHYLEKNTESLGAVGLFTGRKGQGVVILDVDANLAGLKKTKFKDTLKGAPVVTSTKRNAAKYIFTIPEELWGDVSGFGHSEEHNQGYEVLWGPQGVIQGAYPGSKDGKYPPGRYEFEGDPEDVPVAPAWLIAEMKAAKKPETWIKNRTALDLSDRTEDEVAAIVAECLSVIEQRGQGQREHWFKIGCAINSVLPNDVGLELWSNWSRQDADFAHEWERSNPCEPVWNSMKPGGRIGLGTLIYEADLVDPQRKRFTGNNKQILESAESRVVQFQRNTFLNGTELLKRAKELEDTIDNPALLDQEKHLLALEAGRRDTAAVDRLLDADLSYERTGAGGPKKVAELDSTAFQYLIPGLLPKPWTLLVHADGGTGKTAMCQTIAKHISKGKAFNIHGGLVDVPVGKVLWLNGDQNERILRRQFMMIDAGDNIDVVGEWDMQWYRRFCKYQKANEYDLVVIDSLDGCNDANPYEENKREFALPLKRLARRNGHDFPACTIIVIHHNTKEGKFRGTSAIRAAVDETWNMKRATQNEIVEFGLAPQSRIVEVEKSRDDREGQRLVFRLMHDFTYLIGHMKRVETGVQTPNDHTLDMLELMRADQKPWSRVEMRDNEDVGGEKRDRAIKYGFQRLEQQGLIERCDAPVEKRGKGKPPVYYRATGTSVPGGFRKRAVQVLDPDSVSKIENDCTGTDLKDNGGFVQNEIVQNKSGSTPDGACTTETDAVILDKSDFGQSANVLKNDCTGTDLNLDADPWVNKQIDQNLWDG